MRRFIFRHFPRFAYRASRARRKWVTFTHRRYSVQRIKKYIGKKYFAVHGYEMDWEKPASYTQKIQYSKIFNKDKRRTVYSDKIAVRDFIKETIGERYLIPILGVWTSADEIDFDLLPDRFVLKTNHGSSTNIIVRDKAKLNAAEARRKLTDFLKDDFAYYGFELHYAGIRPLIYAEELLNFDDCGVEDYKFLCFDGEIYCFWVDFNRQTDHKRNVYDLEWNLLPWNQWDYGNYDGVFNKPENFEEMVEVAEKLCAGFDHVRVDLYNVRGKIYFGEMTFTNGGGYAPIYPREMDYTLGEQWKLSAVV